MDQVFWGLYVGTLADSGDTALLQNHDVDVVVSLTHGDPETGYPASVSVSQCAMMDGPQNDRETFRDAVRHVVTDLEKGETVLVHCSRGASRSPSVAATAVALYEELDIRESFELVSEQRDNCDPHPALVRQAVSVYREDSQ